MTAHQTEANIAEIPGGSQDDVLLKMTAAVSRYHISRSKLYELAARRSPGFVRLGRSVRVHRRKFEAWLESLAGGV